MNMIMIWKKVLIPEERELADERLLSFSSLSSLLLLSLLEPYAPNVEDGANELFWVNEEIAGIKNGVSRDKKY